MIDGSEFPKITSNEGERHIPLSHLSKSAQLGLRIITGKNLSLFPTLPEEFTWENEGLRTYLQSVAIHPQEEWMFTLGRGLSPRTNGSDWRITKGTTTSVVETRSMYATFIDSTQRNESSVINLHSHSVPLQAHPGDLRGNTPTDEFEIKGEREMKLRDQKEGVIGVTYPTGISDIYWTDLYFMPSLINLKEFDIFSKDNLTPKEKARAALLFFQSLVEIPFRNIEEKIESSVEGRIVDYLMKRFSQGKDVDIFNPLNKRWEKEIESMINKLGIVHYRASISRTDMAKGVERVKFILM